MAGPFTIETTYPAASDIQSQFPSHEQTFRTTVWNWLTTFSDSTDGTLLPAAFDTLLATANTWTADQTFDNVSASGTLGVTGATTLHALTATTGSFSSTLAVTGTATLSSTLAVTGNTTIGGTLGVTGAVTLTVPLAVAQGGTGSTSASDARTALGLGSIATQAADDVAITGGSVTGITDLAIEDGGTGASTAAAARTALFGVSTTTDNTIARYDGTTGALQSSGVTIDDSDNISTTGDVTYSSDERLKENLSSIPAALTKLRTLRAVTYDRRDWNNHRHSAGLIAQDVQRVLPEAVRELEDGSLTLAAGPLIALLTAAIQELADGASV